MEESKAYKKSKSHSCAFIIEDGWLVRVMADNSRVRIKYIGPQEVKIDESQRIIKM